MAPYNYSVLLLPRSTYCYKPRIRPFRLITYSVLARKVLFNRYTSPSVRANLFSISGSLAVSEVSCLNLSLRSSFSLEMKVFLDCS